MKKSTHPVLCAALIVLLVSAWLTTPCCQQNVASAPQIRVLSYNILHGATVNNDFDIDRIARVIREASPDIVALQEVDFKTERAKGMDLVTELGYRTGMAPLFGRAMPYDGGEYGEGILSRYSFISSKAHPLPHSPRNEPRTALEVVIGLPSGDEIVFIGTHLDHTRDQTDRIAQARRINELFARNEAPTILAGDLNAVPDSEPMNILFRFWSDAASSDPQYTFPSDEPRRRIDYVLFLPSDRWRVVETRVIDERIASDHCPLLVVMELLPVK
ncbi:endonuclease/exonuclease/phosphatase family protein [candidate division KSB1 bacterium]